MTWFAVIDGKTGECLSLGTDVDAKMLPSGLVAIALDPAWQPDGSTIWNPSTRTMDPAPAAATELTAQQLADQLVAKGVLTASDVAAADTTA